MTGRDDGCAEVSLLFPSTFSGGKVVAIIGRHYLPPPPSSRATIQILVRILGSPAKN